jgi:arabinofuranan 3-O-arabinosyltransferase
MQGLQTSRLRGRPLAYAIPALVALVAAQTWFTPGTVIAGGDLGPPIAPGSDYISAWNQFGDGVGAPSFDIVALPYYEALRAAAWLGLGPDVFQRLWLSSLFVGAAAAIVFFAFGFLGSPLAAGTAGLLAVFSADRLLAPADPVPLVATVVAGVLGGLVLRVGLRTGRASPALFALASTGLGFVFVNPPHVVLVLAWLAFAVALAWAVGGVVALKRLGRFAFVAVPAAAVVNLWWIVPALIVFAGPGFGSRFAAAGVDAWSWTHQRASVPNALALNTSWAWSHPEYFPYASGLDRAPWGLLRFVPAVLGLAGLVLVWRRSRRVALAFVGLAVPVLFLSKGINPPFAGLSRWLYVHLPGLWLFRDPAKVVLLLGLALALLAGVTIARLAEPSRIVHPRFGGAVALLALAGALVYVRPLFTGEVIPGKRPSLPPMHVRVPAAWTSVGTFLNAQRSPGKVLVLPRPDFYQLPTRWNYYGVSFTRLAIHRGVLESAPGSYFRSTAAVSDLSAAIEGNLLHRSVAAIPAQLRALGVRWVLLRRDLAEGRAGRTIASSIALRRGLALVPGLRHVRSFGSLVLYDFGGRPEVSARTPVAYLGPTEGVPLALGALGGVRAGLAPGDVGRSPPAGRWRFFRIEQTRLWRVSAAGGNGGGVVLDDPTRWSVGGSTLPPSAPRRVDALGLRPPFLATVGATPFLISQRPRGAVPLGVVWSRGETVVRLWRRVRVQSIDPAQVGAARDCYSYDARVAAKVGIAAAVVPSAQGSALRLTARDHSACVALPFSGFRPGARYRVQVEYRHVTGAPPRLCLWEDGASRCAQLPVLASSPSWRTLDGVVGAPSRVSGLRLFLYADGTGNGTTVAEYRRMRFELYAPVQTRVIGAGPEAVGPIALPAGTPSLRVASQGGPAPLDLGAGSAVGDCDHYDQRTLAQVGIKARIVPGRGLPALRLAARDHAACVAFPVGVLDGQARYRLTLEYRRVRGNAPRVCVWQEGPNTCAPVPELQPVAGWHHLDAVVQLDPNTSGLQLFVYADGGGVGETVSEYRRLALQPDTAHALVGIPPAIPLPAVRSERLAPSRVRVRVHDARGRFLLVLTDGFDPGWHIERAGHDASAARHVRADGYANGWLIPWRGTYEVTLVYTPERYAHAARWTSALGAALLLVPLFGGPASARWRRRRRSA